MDGSTNNHIYLDRRQTPLVELCRGGIDMFSEAATNIRIQQTALDILPLLPIHDVILNPIRVISKTVLFDTLLRDRLPRALIRDDVHKHR